MLHKILFIYLAFTTIGCVHKLDYINQADSFSHHELASKKVMLGAIVVKENNALSEGTNLVQEERGEQEEASFKPGKSFTDTEHKALVKQFIEEIVDEREAIKPINPYSLPRKITDESLEEAKHDLEQTGKISDEVLASLKVEVFEKNKIKYFAALVIEDDQGETYVTTESKEETETSGSKKKKKTRQYEIERYNASRVLKSKVIIYDLITGTLAWEGGAKDSKINTNEYKRERHRNLVADLGSSIINGLIVKKSFPSYPSRKSILEYSFGRYAENLPEKE